MADNAYTRFQRGNYVVDNLERAMQFYCGVMGFEVAFTKDSPDDSYSYTVFEIAHKPIRFAVLSLPGQPRVMALTEVPGDKEKVAMPRRAAIVLEVASVDAVVNAATAIGCHVYDESVLNTHDGRVGREVGLVDFDDNLIVIYHIPPAE
ncbi:MAG: VOC family protein [Pseudomonadota bacterium]